MSLPEFIAQLITNICVARFTFIYSYISVGITYMFRQLSRFFFRFFTYVLPFEIKLSKGGVAIPLTGLTPPHCMPIRPKPGPGFPTAYIMVLFVFSELS